ncbi:LOW QUALITY PROTEIN: flocculation protein FLO11 [Drosophila obscura]|uniref:LOW QUALITY PROTEIN: flocculation protein FLO11 n=1 Tax=Drosophila obscura TaxID=7282 RepID=UPI001BB1D509|nr:LOW QUALITY PROTEIN: flocculation protein FLO11 [Drosophila obscura]
MMEQGARKQTATTATTRNRSSASEAPSIVAPAVTCSSSTTTSSSSSSSSSATCSATIVVKQRPPPLKTATTTVTTTLVSSNEGGQPLPPIAQASYRGATATLTTPSTPRIELSRASSSSHHEEDSRESSPENVFEQETIGLGFREEGALELRSSTEELYFMDPEQKKEEQERMQQQQQQTKRSSPHIFKFDDHQSYLQQHQRKDSASSEVAALLCISGRTSRISSVGSQGSAVSRLSAVSCVSRSPSPHRMLLETSFCGPKPLEQGASSAAGSTASTLASSSHTHAETAPGGGGVVTGAAPGGVAANTALLEQLLLARKHDPTQAVLAEGIKVLPPAPATRTSSGSNVPVMGAQRRSTKSPGQMVIGKTPSGTEYIRINLRPDHMYSDRGIAANERVVEAPNQLTPVYSASALAAGQPKPPASLSLQGGGGGGGAGVGHDENRLTPTASPKPGRHALRLGSRSPSPSPAATSVSRKSSFSSLFRLGKDSPDSPRESARARSKSKERSSAGAPVATTTTGSSQNVTPSKQKSVLAIFKSGKRGSSAGTDGTKSSKSSSPIEPSCEPPPPPPPAPGSAGSSGGRSRTPAGSRPGSRLRYYDEPVEGVIHIPLHTPPEEREARTLLQGIQNLIAAPSPPPIQARTPPQPPAAQSQAQQPPTASCGAVSVTGNGSGATITASQLAAAAAALRPVGQRKTVAQRPDLDAIQSLNSQEEVEKEKGWSLEVQRHSSQDSQETLQSVSSVVSARASNLAQIHQEPEPEPEAEQERDPSVRENGLGEMQRLPSVDSTQSACEPPRLVHTVATVSAPQSEDAAAKERRRLLFATRLGSGSQEQIFSTQFSISKTESQSSQLSEQVLESANNSTASDGPATSVDGLQRQGTVIRRTEMSAVPPPPPPRGISSSEEEQPASSSSGNHPAVVLRSKHRSRPTSEDEGPGPAPAADLRHSRYLENFDVRRKLHENVPLEGKEVRRRQQHHHQPQQQPQQQESTPVPRKPKRQSVPEPRRETSQSSGGATPTTPTPTPLPAGGKTPTPTDRATPIGVATATGMGMETGMATGMETPTPTASPDPMLTSPLAERRLSQSTDEHEPVESSESERDSDMAGSSSVTTAVAVGGEGQGPGKRHHFPRNVCVIEEHESTGLVSQESFDDELPYIPTTLPEERAQGVPLIPMKERANMELKTCPVDRPRSTTPLNPSHLEEYCTGIMTPQEAPHVGVHELDNGASAAAGGGAGGAAGGGSGPLRGEKLRISLPRKESMGKEGRAPGQSSKSPRRISNASGKSWFEFAEEGLRANNLERKDSSKQLLPAQGSGAVPVPVPIPMPATNPVPTPASAPPGIGLEEPKPKASTQRKLSGHWIDFENIPEKRKPAKRITTLPKETIAASNTATTSSSSACGSGHRSGGSGSGSGPHHHHHHHHQTRPGSGSQDPNTGGASDKLHYNYVKPEDCQCECHEAERGETSMATAGAGDSSTGTGTGTGTTSDSLASVDLLQQGEDMLPLLDPEPQPETRVYTDEEAPAPTRHASKSSGVARVSLEGYAQTFRRFFGIKWIMKLLSTFHFPQLSNLWGCNQN